MINSLVSLLKTIIPNLSGMERRPLDSCGI